MVSRKNTNNKSESEKIMQVLELVQGSPEWIAARIELFGASEAPAMMNESKFMSRNELLKLKFTGKAKPVSAHLQKIYDKGHATEEMARPIVEGKIDEELYPVTGQLENSKIMASFDGLTMMEDTAFEHKLYNATLAENVRNNVLEMHYVWQLEQQLLVSGAEKVIFVTSDGTEDNYESMEYFSIPERREALIAGWAQFEKDLADYQPEVKKEMVAAKEVESLPLITFEVIGSEITSNVSLVLVEIKERAQVEMNRKLETDQDFADKDKLNKATKDARAKLTKAVEDVQNKFVSYSEFAGVAAEIDIVLQKMQSQGEKQVKQAKEAKKNLIKLTAEKEVSDFSVSVDKLINPIRINTVYRGGMPDFDLAMKGKRTIESLQNAVDSEVAKLKVSVNEVKDKVIANLATLRELAGEYEFLFNDSSELVVKENDDLINLIKMRIADHKAAEAKKLAEQTAQIEAAAKLKAENEAAAKLEAEEKRIRYEERAKVQAEEAEKQQKEHRIAKDKRDQQQEDIASGDAINQVEEKPVKQRLSERFNDQKEPLEVLITNDSQALPEVSPAYTNKHEEMIRHVKFWAKEYGVINSELSDLMNILNQYK